MFVKKPLYREKISALAALVPALAVFFTFTYCPLLMTLRYSFTDWNGFSSQYHWVGFGNFLQIFKDGEVLQAFGNTIYIAVLAIVAGLFFQMSLALVLFEKFKGKNLFRALFYIPCIISPVIASLTWLGFFQYVGIINEVLKAAGMGKWVVDWLGDPKIVKNVLVFINTWQWTGYGMVIFLTGLASVPQEVYESGLMDGATGLKRFRHLTLPLIMPSLTVNLFIGITGALRIFDLPYVMTGGGPMDASKTVGMVIYSNAFLYEKFGFSSSIGLVFFIFIAAITLAQLKVTRSLEVEH